MAKSDRSKHTAGMGTLLHPMRQIRVTLMGIQISTPPVPPYDEVRYTVAGNSVGGDTLLPTLLC